MKARYGEYRAGLINTVVLRADSFEERPKRCGEIQSWRSLPTRGSQSARQSPRLQLAALYVLGTPVGARLEYIEVLSIEYRRVRTAGIVDSWDQQMPGSWIWRTLAVATPRDGAEH